MTEQQFVDQFIDRHAGVLMDALTERRSGAELSAWTRLAYGKLKAMLREEYAAMTAAPTNGHANAAAATPKRN